jgi:hypothetical protein
MTRTDHRVNGTFERLVSPNEEQQKRKKIIIQPNKMTQSSLITDHHIRSAILNHVKHFWPNSKVHEESWQRGPIQARVPGFRILKLLSNTPQRPIIYVTNGCFASEPTNHIRHEFFIIALEDERQHLEILSMLASFHADERYRLDVGSVVNIGSPWIPGSKCDHLLISIPYPYGPTLEWLKLPDICVRFLWTLPITQREAAFVELNGWEALEQKFDAAKVDYINPTRPSIV